MNPGKATGAFFVLAVFFRIAYIFLFPPAGTDHEMIHTAVDNLLSGNGLAFPIANPADLSTTFYEPMNEWPPLVAYLLSVIKAMTGDGRAADLILMSAGMLLLLVVINSMMKVLKLKEQVQVILWLIIAANPEPFRNLGISDLYSGLFLMWGVLFSLRLVQQEFIKPSQIVIASIFFFLPAAFRYQYYPVIFMCPLFLIAAGRFLKNKHLFRNGINAFSIVFFLLVLQVVLLYQQTGIAAKMADVAGFYPENLIWTYPFLLKGFINISYLENGLIGYGHWTIIPYYIITFLFTIFLLYKLFFYLLHKMKEVEVTEYGVSNIIHLNRFFIFSVALSIVGLLIVLSVRYSPQMNYAGRFTYVHEGRYFVAATLLLLLLFAQLLQEEVSYSRISVKQLRRVLVGSMMLINFALFGKFIYNIATDNLKGTREGWVAERKIVLNEIEELQKKYNLPVVAVASQKYFLYQPVMHEYGIIKSFTQLRQMGIKTSHPLQLLIITNKHPNKEELNFIKEKGAGEVYSGRACKMYHMIIGNRQTLASLY
ncbi:MAG: hypothetical protein K2X48_05625 [Chitinophagaceae bacterium]|nr:hypothetical protein [Chitinophagaceae bacterium]